MNAGEQDATRSREEHYQEVSLRAVELLAKAQRAADEAVAEAQSYARDLEESAREQYRQILQRAQAAAQQLASAEGESHAADPAAGGGEATSALDAQQLTYVRTYARVAHAQLKSVLAALNDELDQLAAMAEGAVSGPVPGAGAARATEAAAGLPVPPSGQPAPADEAAPSEAGSSESGPSRGSSEAGATDAGSSDAPKGGEGSSGRRGRRSKAADTANADGGGSTSDPSWPPIFAATNSISYVQRGSAWEGPQF